MRVATALQMAAVDAETIAGGTSGLDLMERAGREIVQRMLRMFPGLAPPARVVICCGKGNNGGDGLVMARLLAGLGFDVTVMLLGLPEELSADARANHERLPAGVTVAIVPRSEWAQRWREICRDADLAVDAVFGTGIQLPVRGPYVPLFGVFNEHIVPVLAVDIPSGVCGDSGRVEPVAVRADATITVGLPKLGLLLPPGRDHCGELAIVDIGFAIEVIERHTPELHYLDRETYAGLLPRRASDAHKYRCGTLLVVAGSRAYGGAAVLAGLGALRSGAGLVTVAVPECVEIPTRSNLPEALIAPLPVTAGGTLAPVPETELTALLSRKHALAIGPGMGEWAETDRFLVDLLPKLPLPLVVDADGLSAFGRSKVAPCFSAPEVVLTPHAGELARLLGVKPAEVEKRRLELAAELASRWGVVLLLKGSPTLIAEPRGTVTINPVGDDALAHGGTGDVLTGLVGGLLAQGCRAHDAALLGAYLHGLAGQIASESISRRSVLAREIAEALGEAFASLEDLPPSDGQPRETDA
jgi:hydroxyethylthiazole kinase-like uncharacterized protein yjeF